MPDFVERLRELDRIEPPDVWSDVERLGPRTPAEQGPSKLRRTGVVLLALGIAAASFLLVNRAFRGRVVVQPGETPSPTISAVGPARNGLIAFNCGFQVCTVFPDGSRLTNLIETYDKNLVVTALMPVFSPDGSEIAFVGYPKGATRNGANYDIYVMNADGTGVTNLTTSPADVQGWFSQDSPRWSPDGSMIAYNSDGEGSTSGLYVMNADGSDQRKIADGWGPTWSPNGSRITFVLSSGHGGDLWTIHPDGTGLTQLTQSPKWDELPTWSPDGSRIAFLREGAIYVVNADGTGLADVVDLKGIDPFQPQWSPDGTRLAFEADNGHDYDIYVVNADGSGLAAIANDPSLDENWPVWSPDGTLIAYGATDNLSAVNSGTYDLYVMRLDGTYVQRLTKDAGLGVEFDISWQGTSG
ncbi:MAG: PD40 domain-containing protein [Actinobacteria bacterium]|nr:PD40 domain-containing protein [Actinomycetota bacterium]